MMLATIQGEGGDRGGDPMAMPTTDPGSLTAAGFKVLVAEDDTLIAMELEAILQNADSGASRPVIPR
jgi:hypothetical protein